ncbi:transcriptional regulator GlxA family with amidase domain [Cupriavidus metallidurans]|jgi:transcriptional regulator GlxA family with amidase domain|uniref:Transcriptional regulator, AraC family with amidase-like domain n=1 Tax=Cupriavidus metallidurans (strain ATCC 43123 / DSM 2839 / NBRC 102507 / CH34) TaxID=266264 RepID=Q1LEN9_CUPMC|nr:GlxA family transcriptional regulator [Cupriavidus metallidurans]ABF11387.1 transcriptional regulator, AraC family with amidase-like domain [Cupriavidus metallidurans CH34]KWW38452.1 HTH-type transcriptional regulator CdhR [Cupriavidus metallidurans]MDE4920333.1 GlxA family transcriptional regulator [Cupriavidus metallidurans]QGS33300.1 helix-turn-helix domain-containing protein [Cupriavidus metallidurans]UBM07856.1 GlxA family transcriptional regulator [Cupriavidus metallidurans]
MHNIGFLLTDGFQVMALATQSVFEYANLVAGEPFYRIRNYSIDGGPVVSSLGMTVETHAASARVAVDTWVLAGVGDPVAQPTPAPVLAFVSKAVPRARRTASICTGAFILAEAGLLDGRRATTHWAFARDMKRLHPDIKVEDDRIYIVDGAIWTSAGMTAGLDLALAMVEKDLGADIARSVAHKLVMHQRRSGGQSQHSELLDMAPKSDRIQSALDYARKNLSQALTVEELAETVHLSPRQFSRVFTAETGQSPAKAIENLRLEAARLMIEQSRHPLEVVAREAGFRDRRHMREAFLRGFGVPPQAVRREARE